MESDKIIFFPLNLDAMLRACVPGGSSCDPQKVSDAIREWVSTAEAGNPRSSPPWIDVRVAEELRKRLFPGEKVIWRDGFRWKDDAGVLSNHYEQAGVESLAADFDYQVIVNAGCAAIIADKKASLSMEERAALACGEIIALDSSSYGAMAPQLYAKGVEAIHDAAAQNKSQTQNGEAVAELNSALGRAFPEDQVSAIKAHGAALPLVRSMAERLALMGKHAAIDNQVIQMLIAAGHITNDIATQAFKIAHGFEGGELTPKTNRSWWNDVKPETDLAEANDVIDYMLEDWRKVGEALGFKEFADPESIIVLCKELFEEAPKPDAAESLALLDGVIAKLARDDEYGLEPDLRSLRRILTAGTSRAQAETPPDDFADIREFRLRAAEMDRQDAERAAEMDRQDAERAAAQHDEFLRSQFPRESSARDKARAAASAYMETVCQEFDTLQINQGSIPEAPAHEEVMKDKAKIFYQNFERDASIPESPAPMVLSTNRHPNGVQPTPWKRDDEKTMLRILLLSAETTGFHGNDPAVHFAKIAKWTNAECRAVDEWCVAMHHHAGDNGVSVPPKPIVLAPASFAEEARPESICGRITKLIAAETRYPEHHFTPVAMTIAQMFNYVDEDALALLDGIAFKLKHGTASDIERDLLALRTRLTKNKRLQS